MNRRVYPRASSFLTASPAIMPMLCLGQASLAAPTNPVAFATANGISHIIPHMDESCTIRCHEDADCSCPNFKCTTNTGLPGDFYCRAPHPQWPPWPPSSPPSPPKLPMSPSPPPVPFKPPPSPIPDCRNEQRCCNAIHDANVCRQAGCKYSRYGCVPGAR